MHLKTIFLKLALARLIMKSFTAIILSLSLLVSTTGLSVLKHYCGGELAKTQVLATQNHGEKSCAEHKQQTDCPHCETEKHACHKKSGEKQEEKPHNCCDNEVEQFKVEDQFVFTSLNFKVVLNSIAITPVLKQAFNGLTHNLNLNLNHYLRAKLPNEYSAPELRVSIQSFLI